jgi:hypothetical protein
MALVIGNPFKESMSSAELTVIQPSPTDLQTVASPSGGMSLNLNSKLFKLKPVTLNIVQPNSQAEGALPGKLRISETGQQFDFMNVVLLLEPLEQRAFYEGEPGSLNRSSENLVCMCRHVTRDEFERETSGPDKAARIPQSFKCHGCANASWEEWRKTKRKEDLPSCDLYYKVLMLDTVLRLPIQMFIRSKSKQTFEAAMQNLARTYAMLKSQGVSPSWYDIQFKLRTKKIVTGKLPSYVLDFADFHTITPEEREEFGPIYQQFANKSQYQAEEDAPASNPIDTTNSSIDAEVLGTTEGATGEITI